MKQISNIILFILPWLVPNCVHGQIKRSPEFKEKYELQEVVILSRHNIRSPLSDNGSILGKLTPHQWTSWSAGPSELTLRGGILETLMGQFFRKWLVEEGIFPENYIPTADEVNFYANSMQRTIATAQYFSSGFMPIANLRINHRYSPSKMDPVFFPRLTKMSDAFKAKALREIADMGGNKGIKGINERLAGSYQLLAEILDFKDSPAYQTGEVGSFNDYDTQIILEKGEEPAMKGTLKVANSASDAFILQYYEENDSQKAAFGHLIDDSEWGKIAEIKDTYGDVLFAAPSVACNVAHPLLIYINDELNSPGRKFTFLCGHDSNITSICAALGIEKYSLTESIEKSTPIGCKLVFEKWKDKEGKAYIAIHLVYQSTEQLRSVKALDMKHPPMIHELNVKGLTRNPDGIYPFEKIEEQFAKAITAYEKLDDKD